MEPVRFRLQVDDFVWLGLVDLLLQAVAILQLKVFTLSLGYLLHFALWFEQFRHVEVDRVHFEEAAWKLLINGKLLSEERVILTLVIEGHPTF